MRKAIILLCVVATTSSSPTLTFDPNNPQESKPGLFARQFQRRGLPPISAVLMALEMESILPVPYVTPTVLPSSVDSRIGSPTSTLPVTTSLIPASITRATSRAISLTRTPLPVTTLPHVGPGIVILSESFSASDTDVFFPEPSNTTAAPTQIDSSKAPGHISPTIRHFIVVGGAFGTIIFLVACCYFVMDPRVWKSCSISRTDRLRLTCKHRFGQHPLPSWMRITPSLPSLENSFEKKGPLTPSPYLYFSPDGLKSKFSMTTASDYSYFDDTFDTATSSPKLPESSYNGHGCPPALSPPLPCYSPSTDRIGRLDSPPVRPPRPPTTDSPAAIDSLYYADVDDKVFYRHPNPIVLEPTSPIINNPPPMPGTNSQSQSHLNFLPPSHRFFSSNPLGIEALQRHARSRSAPILDAFSTSSKHFSGATIATQQTSENAVELECPSLQKNYNRSRKSTSAVSWIRYSEFQKQHHLQLQRQQSYSNERPASSMCAAPKERDDVGSAY